MASGTPTLGASEPSTSKRRATAVVADRSLGTSGCDPAAPVRIAVTTDGRIGAVEGVASGSPEKGLLVMPALANAHDHGRGLRPICYGAYDQALEAWFAALNVHPPVDPYLNAAWAFSRMAGSGIGLVVHCHMAANNPALIDQAVAVCRAAEDVGIRLAFVVPMRNRYTLGYVPDDAVLARLPPQYREQVRKRWLYDVLPAKEQLAIADEIAHRCSSPLVDVLYGPAAPHWCTDDMLEMVAEASARNGRRVHMHCLETRYQREFADAAYPQGVFTFLKEIGLLTDRLTLAHGVELRSGEMEMIAAAGAVVSLNTSSNLRLKSGIAPAAAMAAHGVAIAVGIDALGVDDDEDGFRELRLTHLLHGGFSFDRGLTKPELLAAALRNGGRAVTGRTDHGILTPGTPADMVTLDFSRLSHDVMPGVTPDLEVVLTRATRAHVRSLVIAGTELVAHGQVLGVDERAVAAEVGSQARAVAENYRTARPVLEILQDTLRQCYLDGLHRTPAS